MSCRICGAGTETVLDLGSMPPANRLKAKPDSPETPYPLVLEFCKTCWNLQLGHCVDESELYDSYFYTTPPSASLNAHYDFLLHHVFENGYVARDGHLVEFGSNVGDFLLAARGSVGAVLGVDPARNICEIARGRGVETLCGYFNVDMARTIARERGAADMIVARHCVAHNRNPHKMIGGIDALLKNDGVFLMENAYGLETLLKSEYGQIYHEHMFYFTVHAVQHLLSMHGMRLIDVQTAPVHGGSAVFFAAREGSRHSARPTVEAMLRHERTVFATPVLADFASQVRDRKTEILSLLADLTKAGKRIWMYGASAKASTFVNYLGVDERLVSQCADSTPIKVGRYIPGTGIRICDEGEAIAAQPDYFLVTAWNYADEIIAKVRRAGNRHTGFIIPHPDVRRIDPPAV